MTRCVPLWGVASIVGILCNILLFAIKAVVGTVMGSIAVVADAFNNHLRRFFVNYFLHRGKAGQQAGRPGTSFWPWPV